MLILGFVNGASCAITFWGVGTWLEYVLGSYEFPSTANMVIDTIVYLIAFFMFVVTTVQIDWNLHSDNDDWSDDDDDDDDPEFDPDEDDDYGYHDEDDDDYWYDEDEDEYDVEDQFSGVGR